MVPDPHPLHLTSLVVPCDLVPEVSQDGPFTIAFPTANRQEQRDQPLNQGEKWIWEQGYSLPTCPTLGQFGDYQCYQCFNVNRAYKRSSMAIDPTPDHWVGEVSNIYLAPTLDPPFDHSSVHTPCSGWFLVQSEFLVPMISLTGTRTWQDRCQEDHFVDGETEAHRTM